MFRQPSVNRSPSRSRGFRLTALVILGFLMVMSGATRAADESIGAPAQTRAAEPRANETFTAGQQAAENLKDAEPGAASADFSVSAAVTRAGVATLLLLLAMWILRRLGNWAVAKLATTTLLARRMPPVLATDLQPHIARASRSLLRLMMTAAILALGYLWLVYVFEQFPSTAQWGERLGDFLVGLLVEFGTGILSALPGLFIVLVIFVIARWCVRIVTVVFKEIQAGTITLRGFERETARTTQTLFVFAIWLFALVFAYPHIPGSDTAAFQGLSVLVGLMVTLGSTGLINQVISGLFVIYSRSVRPQDYVRINDIEGEVINIGSLAIKLRTPRQEEITIPHSVVVSAATTNFSRLAGEDGMVITAWVTIGYNVPWRQVHALLFLGASRTPGVRRQPPPQVLQRELSNNAVEYQLLAHLEESANRARAISELHAQIQDAFNEYGVQIMVPSFESQPEKPVLVPKSDWYAAPAGTPETSPEQGSNAGAKT